SQMQLADLRRHGLLYAAALSLWACGGGRLTTDFSDAGPDGGLQGASCQFDSDCQTAGQPPALICAPNGTCQPSCLTLGCPADKHCNTTTGRCDQGSADAGTDGGSDGGSDAGTGTPSDTLCKPC